MKQILFLILISANSLAGCSQGNSQKQKPMPRTIGGGCEGCEVIYESPVPFENLSWIDTLPDYNERGPKLVVSGVIYQADGKPAKDVVLYIYHTDQTGHYTNRNNEKGYAGHHGYIKGWMKTNTKGQYRFYTLKPVSYPDSKIPAHIHPVIKEPNKNDYWIDEFLFDDDPFLTAEERKKNENRGGNGILSLVKKNGVLYAERDIYLGRNVPDYPGTKIKGLQSGLDPGDNCPAFDPLHLSGADAGRQVCPMCKYGYGQGVMVWFNHNDPDRLARFAKALEKEMQLRGEKNFRAFLVYMNPSYKENDAEGMKILQQKIRDWCEKQNLQKLAVVWIPSPVDKETAGTYKINPKAQNTVFVYKKRQITAKWVDIDYSDASVQTILRQF
jgi:protocatechuate 3,4-dioxygenase beta subunit